jgi:transposase, IS30 family
MLWGASASGYRWFKAARGKNPFGQTILGSGHFLSLDERLRIADLRITGAGVRQIAAALGRAPSTVSRELASNSAPGGRLGRHG